MFSGGESNARSTGDQAMTDRELLELAARAAGIEIEWNVMINRDSPFLAPKTQQERNWLGHEHTPWNPLDDDGDALRLGVALRIKHERHPIHPFVAAWAPEIPARFEEPEGDDPYAATRLAIVRAAAEIGKHLETKP